MSLIDEPNGPAVPRIVMAGTLTLRDWFAGQALAIYSDPRMVAAVKEVADKRQTSVSDGLASACYEIADAFLKHRSQP